MNSEAPTPTPGSTDRSAEPDQQVRILARDEGRHLHFLNNLATVKVSPGSDGSMSAVEFVAPYGFGPPLHSHRDEDELVVVLDGDVVFRTGDDEVVATAGACAYLPHAIAHTFQVLSPSARMLAITSSATTVPAFDRMVTALGQPTDRPTIPAEMDIDPGRVALVNAEHGIDVLGPPPVPLR